MSARQNVAEVAGGVIVSPLGEVAVVNQSGTSWSLPKGHLEQGESHLDAARREVYEETGLTSLSLHEELGTYERGSIDSAGGIDETRRKTIRLYLFTAPAASLAPRDPDNPEARWATPAEAVALLSHPADQAALTRALPQVDALAAAQRAASDTEVRKRLTALLPSIPEEEIAGFLSMADAPHEELVARAVRSLDKPYGENHILVDSGQWGVSFARLLPGRSSSYHFHHIRKEFFRVRTGTLTLRQEDGSSLLHPLDCGTSTPGIAHSIGNDGQQPVELVEIFSPALLDDKERVSDRYGRPLGQVAFGE
ncbi:NUDIX domain-containing protein [Streptomyces sp. Agncl-13]|uniref:NUDIX domain-containing protein n=1 Tax=Streptomyces sp. Agncl-13 TaxID=3400628 RepID=UPI003A844DD2